MGQPANIGPTLRMKMALWLVLKCIQAHNGWSCSGCNADRLAIGAFDDA
jgi:hypothetical protein